MTAKQAKFVEAYLYGPRGIFANATRAAEAAGYAWPGKQGPRLTQHPEIAAALDAYLAEIERESDEFLGLLAGK